MRLVQVRTDLVSACGEDWRGTGGNFDDVRLARGFAVLAVVSDAQLGGLGEEHGVRGVIVRLVEATGGDAHLNKTSVRSLRHDFVRLGIGRNAVAEAGAKLEDGRRRVGGHSGGFFARGGGFGVL